MPRRPEKTQPVVVKRPANERKRLPPELEAFARSQDEKLRVPRPRVDRGRVNDPREGYTIPGVANRDARSVYDVRAEAMRALWADGQAGEAALAELGQLLHDAQRLVLWRARRLTGFEAFAEEVVGIPAKRAQELVDAHATASGEAPGELSERHVAAWLRTEAGAYEGDERARARISSTPDGLKLVLSVSLSAASVAFAGVGNRHAPLAREAEGGAPVHEAHARKAPPVPSETSAVEALPAGARLLTRKRRDDEAGEGADEAPEVRPERSERPVGPRQAPAARGEGARERQAAPRDRREKRPALGGERTFGAHAAGGQVRGFSRAPAGDKRGFASEKPAFREKPTFGAKPGAKPFGEKRAERPAFGEKRGAGARGSFGEKRPFGERPAGGDKRGGFKSGGFKSGGFKGGQGGGFKGAGGGGFKGSAKGGGASGGGFKRPFDKSQGAGKGFAGKAVGKKGGGFATGKGARRDDAGDE